MTLSPEVVYRGWQDRVSYHSIDVLLDGGWFQPNDDGSHKWRYMTNLRCGSDVRPKEELGFVLRNLDETAELWLTWYPWTDPQDQANKGVLRLTTTTASMSTDLSEDDCKALTESMRKLMCTSTLSATEERQIQAIGTILPCVYTVTEQIYSSPIIRSDNHRSPQLIEMKRRD